MTSALRFNTAEVQDLYCMLLQPSLLDEQFPDFKNKLFTDQACHKWCHTYLSLIQSIDQAPSELQKFLQEKTQNTYRLGRYFESLLQFWLEQVVKAPNVFPGLIVQDGKQTIGEFDFIFQASSQESADRIHLEASVKFYLFAGKDPSEAQYTNRFFGTMLRDRLDLKIDKLFSHQLQLSQSPFAKRTLSSKNLRVDQAYALMKGVLFYPLRPSGDSSWQTHPFPKEVSPLHSRGWWCTVEELTSLPDEDHWAILPKLRWLSPFYSKNFRTEDYLTRRELDQFAKNHFAEHRAPIMVAKVNQNNDGSLFEVSRGVIVDSEWFSKARKIIGD